MKNRRDVKKDDHEYAMSSGYNMKWEADKLDERMRKAGFEKFKVPQMSGPAQFFYVTPSERDRIYEKIEGKHLKDDELLSLISGITAPNAEKVAKLSGPGYNP